MSLFLNEECGQILSQPNNTCTVGWLSWLVALNNKQHEELINYLSVVGFHKRMGWKFEWTSQTFSGMLKNDDRGVFYLNFPEILRGQVAGYFMGIKLWEHKDAEIIES